MTVLTIADCHGHLNIEELKVALEPNIEAVEAVILLGDNDLSDIEKVLAVVPEELPILGVLGNHDSKDFYEEVNKTHHDRITDISGKVVRLKGTRIGGLSGSLRYKDGNCYCMYTEKEYEAFLKGMECDVLVSHTPPSCCTDKDADKAHRGIKALTKYIKANRPFQVLYGHVHKQDCEHIGGTSLKGCYGIQKQRVGFFLGSAVSSCRNEVVFMSTYGAVGYSLRKFIDAGRESLRQRNYLSALAVALALPSMCSRVQYQSSEYEGKYWNWDDKNEKQHWKDKDCYVDFCREVMCCSSAPDVVLTKMFGQKYAEALYDMRCNFLHTGTSEIRNDADGSDIILKFDKDGIDIFHDFHNGKRTTIKVETLCETIFRHIFNWGENRYSA